MIFYKVRPFPCMHCGYAREIENTHDGLVYV